MPGTGNLAKNPWFLGVGWGGPIITTLLNGHCIKTSLKSVSPYLLVSVALRLQQRSFLCSECG